MRELTGKHDIDIMFESDFTAQLVHIALEVVVEAREQFHNAL